MKGQNKHTDFDVCIVGAGIAGSAMAYFLGQQGHKVLVVEKTFADQDRIVGELLQPGGVILLEKMGLTGALNGIDAQSIDGYGIFFGKKRFNVPYPNSEGEVLKGRGFRYEKLLDNLRRLIRQMDEVTLVDGQVTSITEAPDGQVNGVRFIRAGNTDEVIATAPLTIMSDGCFSSFRKNYINVESKVTGYFIGLILENCELPYPNHGHVILGEPSPFLAYPVNSGQVRMLIDYPYAKAPRLGKDLEKYLEEVIGPQIPEELRSGFAKAIEEKRVKVMPNHLLPSVPKPKKGIVLIGDALNMRHPLTGGGMTVALTDVYALSQKLKQFNSFEDIQSVAGQISRHYAERSSQTATINILADALYQVFKHPDLRGACFDYLERGESYYADPIALLAGISRDRNVLLRHFFAVAQFGAMQAMKQEPFPDNVRKAYRMIQAATNIITPLLDNENPGVVVKTMLKGSKILFPQPKPTSPTTY